jgi:hypothetical protein
MTKYTARAFEKAHESFFEDNTQEFLDHFKACGCYLDDFRHAPVDHLRYPEREKRLDAAIDGVARRIKEMDPYVLAILLRKINTRVEEAVRSSGRQPIIVPLPFPGRSHQAKYKDKLCELIQAHIPPK